MEKIDFLVQQKERSRKLFMETGDRGHLSDMNYFEDRIQKEKRKPADRLGCFLMGLMVVTILSPFISFFLFYR